MADNEEEILPPYVQNDEMLKVSVSALLLSWGLSDLKEKFKSHQVETRALLCLTEKDICELIPKIGRRAIFRSNLLEWRKQNRRRFPVAHPSNLDTKTSPKSDPKLDPKPDQKSDQKSDPKPDPKSNNPIPNSQQIKDELIDTDEDCVLSNENFHMMTVDGVDYNEEQANINQSMSVARRFSDSTPCKRSKGSQIDVNEILNNSYDGLQIIAYYEVNGNLDYSNRRKLVTLLINEVIHKNRWLVQEDFDKMSNEIVQMFPREDKKTYYVARNGSKNPKGCLYNKFLNITRKLRQEGILQYRNDVQMRPGEMRSYRESF